MENKFIEKAKLKHGEKYDYSRIEYLNTKTKILIICKLHGEFKQRPDHHLLGSGCPSCSGNNKKIETFQNEAIKIHADKYDYSFVVYNNIDSKIKIICKKHGEFEQTPRCHLRGNGCQKCSGNKKNTQTDVLSNFYKIHGDKFDYSLVKYNGANKNIKIICKEHGEFKQLYTNHLSGQGCPKCRGLYKTNKEFIRECKLKHSNLYDYSKTNYINIKEKIEIICKIHGSFLQKPSNHLSGQGCPSCLFSKGELFIKNYLINNNIEYKTQHTFDECKNKNKLPFDFYLFEKNICIEYNGLQHYKPIEYFGGEIEFQQRVIRDKIKADYCKINNINLIIIKYNDDISIKLKEI